MAEHSFDSQTDSIEYKLRHLVRTHQAGDYDTAMSLAASVKDSLQFVRQNSGPVPESAIPSDHRRPVTDLPTAWRGQAEGWQWFRSFALHETVGLARGREIVEFPLTVPADEVHDLARELRLVHIDPQTKTLHEQPVQVDDIARQGESFHCRVVLSADVPAHGQSTFLLLTGNPAAELADWQTDLVVEGEGFGLDITNRHFVASLSRQMGQLERLTLRREHGQELFAGGKGHGEPPTIDWSHDYVSQGGYQKLRIRAWPTPPNWEVIRGPLAVRVRRWGFPASPLHPVFAPARMHMDQSYIFHAGQPYFLKEARFDVLEELPVEAARDDEWVFSGYSFNEQVWIDGQGKLHDGKAPAEGAWGVGFYHRDSRDAFIALWLQHEAHGFGEPMRNPYASLHYDGHGQLWARYPVRKTTFPAGASLVQKNAYVVSPFDQKSGAGEVEQLRHKLLNPLAVQAVPLPQMAARPGGRIARTGEGSSSAALKQQLWTQLNTVRDEQLYGVTSGIVDLGYVRDVRFRRGTVEILLTMPHRGRPVADFLVWQGGGRVETGIREQLLSLPGVNEVLVRQTWEPAWTPSRLSTKAREELGLPSDDGNG